MQADSEEKELIAYQHTMCHRSQLQLDISRHIEELKKNMIAKAANNPGVNPQQIGQLFEQYYAEMSQVVMQKHGKMLQRLRQQDGGLNGGVIVKPWNQIQLKFTPSNNQPLCMQPKLVAETKQRIEATKAQLASQFGNSGQSKFFQKQNERTLLIQSTVSHKNIQLEIRGNADMLKAIANVKVNPTDGLLKHDSGLAQKVLVQLNQGQPNPQHQLMVQQSQEWIASFGQLSEGAIAMTASGSKDCSYFCHINSPKARVSDPPSYEIAMGNLRTSMYNILDTVCNLPMVRTLAIPPISCSAGQLKIKHSAMVMINNIVSWCICNDTGGLERISIVCFTHEEHAQFYAYMEENFFNK